VDTSEECIWEAELYRIKGELLLLNGEPEVKVESCFKQGMEIAKRQRAKSLELRSTLSLSRLYKKQGKSEIARGILREIYDWFSEGYNTPNLRDAKSLLNEMPSTSPI
jgi:predicted ATPase